MRSHLQIITDAGGYKDFAARIGHPAERVRFWERRQSIPHEQWAAVVAAGLATIDELLGVPLPVGPQQDAAA